MKIKFITLNIWDGGRLFDSVVSFLKKENPDIIVAQEVYDGKNRKFEKRFRTIEILKRELGLQHFAFSPSFLDTRAIGNVEQGNAVFSKFPITSNKTRFFDILYSKFSSENTKDYTRFPPILQQAVVALNNVSLNVFNVHGIWGFDGRDNERRLEMSKIITREIKDKQNVILAGDFNVQPDTKTIQNIEKYLKNVFKHELQTTFNMRHKDKGGYATAVVDMIFVSKTIKITNHYCPQVDISDHLPLVCSLEL